MNMDAPKIGLAGYWILVAKQVDENGEILEDTARHLAEFPNLITNVGLDMIGNQLAYNQCLVGTGSATPAFTDTTLQSRIASSSTTVANSQTYVPGPPAEYAQSLITYQFAAGVAAGNLSEIGVAAGVATPLFSRALILDGAGLPTTITVLASEVLQATYILRMVPPAGDSTGQMNIVNGNVTTTYNYTTRPSTVGSWQNFFSSFASGAPSMTAYNGPIGTRAAQPTGTQNSGTGVSNAYSNGTKTRSYTGSYSIVQGNFIGGITAFTMSNGIGSWQFGIDSGANIPKNGNQVLSVTFNVAWDRV